MKRDNDETYSTMDAFVSAFLVLRGFKAELVHQSGKVVFVFGNSEILEQAITDYHLGAMVKAAAFAASVKMLKGKIHDLRRTDKGDGHGYSRFRT